MEQRGAPALSQSTLIAPTMPEQLSEAQIQPEGGAEQGQLGLHGSADSQGSGVQGLQVLSSFQGGQVEQPAAGAGMEQPGGGAAGLLGHPTKLGGTGQGEGGVEAKRSICFDFTKNQCTRGAACKFSHDVGLIITVNSQEKGICFDYLKGLCTRGLLCRFSHDLRNLQTPQCTASSAKKRFAPICYDFVKNQCTRGEECKYSHDYSSILYGPRAPGKDPYVICVDFTRGKCARGASCRYSHVDPRILSSPALPTSGAVHPALLAAGLGAAAAAAAVAQTSAMPGAMQGALAGLNAASLAAPARPSSDLQAQAALLLSGLGRNGLLGTGLPGTPVASCVSPGTIPAAWNGMQQQGSGGLQQSPAEIAALLEQMQRTALTDSLAQLSPTAANAASLSNAFNALMSNGSGSLSPTYSGGGLDASALAASLLQHQAGMVEQQIAAYRQSSADAAALLQSHLSSDSSQLGGGLSGSAATSATPTPTAAGMAPTVFSMPRVPSPPMDVAATDPTPRGPSPAPQAQPLMPMYHPLLQKPASSFQADILVDAHSASGSPTIGANWGTVAGQESMHEQQPSALAQQLKQQAVNAGLPPPPPPVHVVAPQQADQLHSGPHDMPSSFDQMQLIWGQRTIWGQRQ